MTTKTKTRPPIRKLDESQGQAFAGGQAHASGYKREVRPRALNKQLLVATLVIAVLLSSGLHLWHDYQINRLARTLVTYGDDMVTAEKWRQASDAYSRAWDILREPELLAKLAPAYDQLAQRYDRRGVIGYYQRALGGNATRTDLRLRLTELLLEEELYGSAREQAEKVLAADADHLEAAKWSALATLGLRRNGKLIAVEQVVDQLTSISDKLPEDIELAVHLAQFLREDRELASDHEPLADRIMDRMVRAASEDPQAYMARHRYRRRFQLAGAKQDLNEAVTLAPEDPLVLLEAARDAFRDANRTQSQSDFLVARELFRRLIDLQPTMPEGYLGLGDVVYGSGRYHERLSAIDFWKEGKREAGNAVLFDVRITEAQVQNGRLAEAKESLDALDAYLASTSDQSEPRRSWGLTSAAFLRGLWHLKRDELHLASVALADASHRFHGGVDQRTTAFTAMVKLGQTQARLGELEEAAVTFDRALEVHGESPEALRFGAEAWSQLGDFDTALDYLERLRDLRPAFDLPVQAARYQLQKQITLPPAERTWSAFLEATEAASTKLASSWRLALLEADYLHRTRRRSEALGQLLMAEREFPDEVELWRQLVFIYEALGRPADANRALERLEEITVASFETKLLTVDLLLTRQQPALAQRVLDGQKDGSLNALQRWRKALAQHDVLEFTGDDQRIDHSLIDLAERYPHVALPLHRLLDRRLRGASVTVEPSNEQLLAQLRSRSPRSAAMDQYFSTRLELSLPAPDMQRVDEQLGLLRARLGNWSRTQELVGRWQLQLGDQETAISTLKQAVRVPARTPRLSELLRRSSGDHAPTAIWDGSREIPCFLSVVGRGRSTQLQSRILLGTVEEAPPSDSRAVDASTMEHQRMQAIDLLRRGRPADVDQAKLIFEQLVHGVEPSRTDQLLLAESLTNQGDAAAATQVLEALATSQPTQRNRVRCVDALLRAEEYQRADQWLEQLEQETHSSPVTAIVRLRARYLLAQELATVVEPLVERWAHHHLASPWRDDVPRRIAQIVRMYRELAMDPPAERWSTMLVDRFPNHVSRLFEHRLTSSDIQLLIENPVDDETARQLARILAVSQPDDETCQHLGHLLDAALANEPDLVSANFARALVSMRRNELPAARLALARVTELQPNHYLAWNALALASLWSGDSATQALPAVDQAIYFAALDVPRLFDTKAVVFLHQGRASEAARLLGEMAENTTTLKPRVFYHLALACQMLNQVNTAKEAMSLADALGFQPDDLMGPERDQLQALRNWLSKGD